MLPKQKHGDVKQTSGCDQPALLVEQTCRDRSFRDPDHYPGIHRELPEHPSRTHLCWNNEEEVNNYNGSSISIEGKGSMR